MPSLPASTDMSLGSSLLPHLLWLYPDVPNFVFHLEPFNHPIPLICVIIALLSAFLFSSLVPHSSVFSFMWSLYRDLCWLCLLLLFFSLETMIILCGVFWFFFLPFVLLCISLSLPELSNFLYLLSESSKGLTWRQNRRGTWVSPQAMAAQKHIYRTIPLIQKQIWGMKLLKSKSLLNLCSVNPKGL